MSDTIVALASGIGGAISVIRISGKKAIEKVGGIVEDRRKYNNAKNRYAFVCKVADKDGIVDEVLVIKYGEPKSFTGENVVEIFSHGGKRVVEDIIECLLRNGCRYAKRGEFTRRAFENGKTDLLKAEAINAIINSRQRLMARNAVKAYMGEHDKRLHSWKQALLRVQAHIESVIEFGEEEEDVKEGEVTKETKREIEKIEEEIQLQIGMWERMVAREEGIEVVLVGPPNAGKSSLMNAMLGYERSLVYEKAGTTRDTVSENIVMDGNEIRLVDTAGLCSSREEVEKMGVERAWGHINRSEVVLWVSSSQEELLPEEKEIIEKRKEKTTIAVINKNDACQNREKERWCKERGIEYIRTSALTGEGIEMLMMGIGEKVKAMVEDGSESCFIVSCRQKELLSKLVCTLKEMKESWGLGIEIGAYHCREAVRMFEEYEGYEESEEMINRIFDQFCIGK